MEHSQHVPVLLDEVMTYLRPQANGRYIDGTLGGGGHTQAILEQSDPDGRVLAIDTDAQAIARVTTHLAHYKDEGRLVLVHGNFADLQRFADETDFTDVQGVLLDLGFSSDQMNNAQRGFSFSADGPLDMRLDASLPLSAADLVNTLSEQELADIFWRYGEEHRSRQIARRIVRAREKDAITRTSQLASLAASGIPHKPGTIHPATRTFQALRIAVNHELESLETVLPHILDVLHVPQPRAEGEDVKDRMPDKADTLHMQGGRMAIISFHSLEDRIVKEFMRRESRDCICPPHVPICVCGHKARLKIITAKPVVAGEREVEQNLRARSAKLRVAEAIA
ncbi:MAG TPA: 16S rRNA (cytosine(1402)-N(4))-methyltransferase [Ktedonobacter sp.]|nr:16S rRNA (cytosine(1402)-N(4))-methyltransferase [Ktedonobacter sp.]